MIFSMKITTIYPLVYSQIMVWIRIKKSGGAFRMKRKVREELGVLSYLNRILENEKN